MNCCVKPNAILHTAFIIVVAHANFITVQRVWESNIFIQMIQSPINSVTRSWSAFGMQKRENIRTFTVNRVWMKRDYLVPGSGTNSKPISVSNRWHQHRKGRGIFLLRMDRLGAVWRVGSGVSPYPHVRRGGTRTASEYRGEKSRSYPKMFSPAHSPEKQSCDHLEPNHHTQIGRLRIAELFAVYVNSCNYSSIGGIITVSLPSIWKPDIYHLQLCSHTVITF